MLPISLETIIKIPAIFFSTDSHDPIKHHQSLSAIFPTQVIYDRGPKERTVEITVFPLPLSQITQDKFNYYTWQLFAMVKNSRIASDDVETSGEV